MFVATAIVGILLAVAFSSAGGAKLAAVAAMRSSAEHLGLPYERYRLIGVLELLGSIGLLVGIWYAPRLGVAAAACLAILMLGAVWAHRRAGDPTAQWAPAAVLALIACAYVGLRLAAA